MTEKLSTIGKQILCTESSEYIDTPPGLKKPLYDYQKRVVKAVLDLEAQRHIKAAVPIHLRSAKFTDYPLIAMTNACIISEPFGSGKTIETLGIIASRAPTPIFENNNAVIGDTSTMIQRQYGDRDMLSNSNIGYITEIQRKYNSVVGVSIIVVGTQVLGQWLNAIKEFTEFKVFVIGNYHSLKQFVQIYRDGLIGSYDIILIKNGVVSGILDLGDGHAETLGSITSILTVVGTVMRGVACQWLVYDDFDTIRIPPGTRSLCGLFTIYISATSNDADSRNRYYYANDRTHKVYSTMNEFLGERMNQVITTAVRDQILNTNFNVRSDPAFVEHSVKLPKYTAYTCSYMNPNDKLIHLLGVMGTPDATNIMEGLNADAINYVASAVGISTDPNPFNIFQKLLDKEFEKYELDCLVILAADAIEAYYKSINGMLVDHPNGHHSAADQDKLRSAIVALAKRWRGTTTRNVVPSDIKFEYSSPSIAAVIEETRREFTTKKIIDGKAIDNVKANLKEGECAVCCLPLEDIVIAKCCTITVCGICMKGSFQLRKHEDYKTKVETIVGKCPHCSKAIDMKQDLIYVTRGIDLSALVASTGVEIIEPPPVVEAPVVKPDADALYQTDHPKLQALYDIIKGKKPKAALPTTYKMKNLIEGVVDRPFPANLPRKILVFAGFAETLGMIGNYLNKIGVNTMHLGGTHLEIAKTVNEFEAAKTDTVLLVNSNQICAGLNIQFSTDIVFMHRIYNRNIEGQVAGRAQRCGRKYNLNIWFILYNNEAEK